MTSQQCLFVSLLVLQALTIETAKVDEGADIKARITGEAVDNNAVHNVLESGFCPVPDRGDNMVVVADTDLLSYGDEFSVKCSGMTLPYVKTRKTDGDCIWVKVNEIRRIQCVAPSSGSYRYKILEVEPHKESLLDNMFDCFGILTPEWWPGVSALTITKNRNFCLFETHFYHGEAIVPELHWMRIKDGVSYEVESESYRDITTNTVINKLKIETAGNYRLSIEKINWSKETYQITVREICLAEKGSYNWPETEAHHSVALTNCLRLGLGNIVRECHGKGEWAEPDFSECIELCEAKELTWNRTHCTNVTKQLTEIYEDIDKSTAEEISETLLYLAPIVKNKHVDLMISCTIKLNMATGYQDQQVFANCVKTVSTLYDRDVAKGNLLAKRVTQMIDEFTEMVEFVDEITIETNSISLSLLNTSSLLSDKEIELKQEYSTVTFPKEILDSGDVILSGVLYRGTMVRERYHGNLAPNVLDVTVRDTSIFDLRDPVLLDILQTYDSRTDYECVWEMTDETWSIEGCDTRLSEGRIVCACDHLTNFALLMTPHLEGANDGGTTAFSITCLMLSVCGGLAAIFTILFIKKLRQSKSSQVHLNLAIAIVGASSAHLVGEVVEEDFCLAIAFFKQVFYLSAMTWSLSEAVTMYIAFVTVFGSNWSLWHLLIPSWGAPLSIGFSTMLINTENYSIRTCWLSPSTIWWGFLGFVYAIILTNSVLFILILKAVYTSQSNKTKNDDVVAKVRQAAAVMVLLGVGWSLGALMISEDIAKHSAVSYLFILINAPQGLYIFLLHIAARPDVRAIWRRFVCRGTNNYQSQTTSSTLIYGRSTATISTRLHSTAPNSTVGTMGQIVEEIPAITRISKFTPQQPSGTRIQSQLPNRNAQDRQDTSQQNSENIIRVENTLHLLQRPNLTREDTTWSKQPDIGSPEQEDSKQPCSSPNLVSADQPRLVVSGFKKTLSTHSRSIVID